MQDNTCHILFLRQSFAFAALKAFDRQQRAALMYGYYKANGAIVGAIRCDCVHVRASDL
jgi:hypothetical protein